MESTFLGEIGIESTISDPSKLPDKIEYRDNRLYKSEKSNLALKISLINLILSENFFFICDMPFDMLFLLKFSKES